MCAIEFEFLLQTISSLGSYLASSFLSKQNYLPATDCVPCLVTEAPFDSAAHVLILSGFEVSVRWEDFSFVSFSIRIGLTLPTLGWHPWLQCLWIWSYCRWVVKGLFHYQYYFRPIFLFVFFRKRLILPCSLEGNWSSRQSSHETYDWLGFPNGIGPACKRSKI